MSNLLSRAAVGSLEGKEAQEICGHYLETGPEMVLAVHASPVQPQGTDAGDKLTKPL